jgi:hypothetical protein
LLWVQQSFNRISGACNRHFTAPDNEIVVTPPLSRPFRATPGRAAAPIAARQIGDEPAP